jgi:hypothetical protein
MSDMKSSAECDSLFLASVQPLNNKFASQLGRVVIGKAHLKRCVSNRPSPDTDRFIGSQFNQTIKLN